MGQMLSELNSETMFRILSSMRTFWTLNMKAGLKVYFFLTCRGIFKILSPLPELKKQFFYGRKMTLFCYPHSMAWD